MESGKTFTREFKMEMVKLITEGGASVAQVARDLEIPATEIYQWIKELSSRPEEEFPGLGHPTSDAEIIRELRREIERLKTENEILRKKRGA